MRKSLIDGKRSERALSQKEKVHRDKSLLGGGGGGGLGEKKGPIRHFREARSKVGLLRDQREEIIYMTGKGGKKRKQTEGFAPVEAGAERSAVQKDRRLKKVEGALRP